MAATVLALAADALVLADAKALLALAHDAVMLAYLRSPAFLALALEALVGPDARPQALLARAPAAVMLVCLRSAAFVTIFPVVRASFSWHVGSYRLTLLRCARFELYPLEPGKPSAVLRVAAPRVS